MDFLPQVYRFYSHGDAACTWLQTLQHPEHSYSMYSCFEFHMWGQTFWWSYDYFLFLLHSMDKRLHSQEAWASLPGWGKSQGLHLSKTNLVFLKSPPGGWTRSFPSSPSRTLDIANKFTVQVQKFGSSNNSEPSLKTRSLAKPAPRNTGHLFPWGPPRCPSSQWEPPQTRLL